MRTYQAYLGLGFLIGFVGALSQSAAKSARLGRSVLYASSTHHADQVANVLTVQDLQNGLKIRRLPGTELLVSEICLGTMNFGEQLDETKSIELLNEANSRYGINFFDTAESYPAPHAASTCGTSEIILGKWIRQKGSAKRNELVISTKVCGYSKEMTWLRKDGSGTRLSREQIIEAVDKQLERLGTDYIDLLHLHWPERYVPLYGAPDYRFELERSDINPIREQIETMNHLIKSGKIRSYGLSNETPYGIGIWTTTAELLGMPKPCVIQNAYNLLNRNDMEQGMLEACSPIHGNLGLLAYSPLGGGVLTGKYLDPLKIKPNYRLRQYVGFMNRYISPPATQALTEYQDVANDFSLPLGPIALAFVYSRKFVSSTIIGVSSKQQLRENVLALNIPVEKELAEALNAVYSRHRDPTKGVFDIVDPNIEYVDPSKLPWGAKDQDVDPELDVLISQRMSQF